MRAIPWLRDRRLLAHPGLVLPVLAALAIAVNGGIDYLPYTVDEFTNWIGVSRQIYLHDGYAAVRETIAHPGYMPGWQIALLFPWLVLGEMDMGQSAGAPLVLHAGLAALVFEVLRAEVLRRGIDSEARASMMAWAGVLLYLAAEGTGKLWPSSLLIEQPQIYALTASLLYLYLIDRDDKRLLTHLGLAVAAGYLLKSAMMTFLPGLALVLAMLAFGAPGRSWSHRAARFAQQAAIVLSPVVAVAVLWKLSAPGIGQGCLTNPMATFTPEVFAKVAGLDWKGLMARMAVEAGGYVATYKTVVLAAAAVGAAAALVSGRWLWLLALSAFAAVYMLALYWYHLTCFGAYYFETLNSIPRFTRVVVQPFHAVGLVALAVLGIGIASAGRLGALLDRKPATVALAVGCAALLSWQAIQLHRSADDVTTRRYQSVDTRLAEVRATAAFVRDTLPAAPTPPLVQFISQGTDADLLSYAKMYALDGTRGHPRVLFRAATDVSWNPGKAINIWQRTMSAEALTATFRKADVIWPIIVDDFTTKILTTLVSADGGCDGKLVNKVLVKTSGGAFSCRDKPGARNGGQ